MRVLGVDPGSGATGFGLVERRGGRVLHLRHGVIRPPRDAALADRLAFLHRELHTLLAESAPGLAVVERVFVAANPRSALVLGQARGALLASLGAAGVPVRELGARHVKKAITGTGDADKRQMQTMVTRLLELEAPPPTDAADALALALTSVSTGALADLPLPPRRRTSRRATTRFVLGRAR